MPRANGLALIVALAACAGAGRTSSPRPTPGGAVGDSVQIVIASTTDVHGRLRGWDYYADAEDSLRGLARAATIIDSVRQVQPGRVILVDAGDLLQGNPLTFVAARVDSTAAHPVVAAMNALQYDAAALGNHEFNYGLPTLERAIGEARFPFLAANAFLANGKRAAPASRIVERSGVRIGIVGATNPGVAVWDRDNVAGRWTFRDIVSSVRDEVRALDGRADAIVVVVHSGLGEPSSYDTVGTGMPSENVGARIAREVPGVNVVVLGHSHRELADSVINGVTIVQARNWATSVSLATLHLRRAADGWHISATRGALVQAAGHAESPAIVAATARAHDATVAYVRQTLGTTAQAWRADSSRVADAPIIDFMLDVMRRQSGADLAATASFDLGAALPAGPITVAQVARLYPYDNTLRAVRITGRQLREYLEYSARYYRTFGTPEWETSPTDPRVPGYNFDIVAGADYTLDLSRPLGQRVTRLEVKGRPVADSDTFTLALNNYRQTGGGGFAMLRGAPVVYDHQEEIRDLLIAEVRRRGVLQPADFSVRNWRLEPAAARAAAYAAMHASAFDTPGAVGAAAPAQGRRLRIIASNDFHGALEARADGNGVLRGGAPYFATAIRRAREECVPPACVSVWLDGGDEFQGTPVSNLGFGRPVVEVFSRLGLNAAALGNHEFDWGLDTLRARMREAPYPILGANVRDATGADVAWIPNDTILDVQGERIGVVGISTVETPSATRPTIVAGLRFVDPVPVVNAHAKALRARGAQAVVVVAHAGAFCDRANADSCNGEIVRLAQGITERVDAIVSGHTHSRVATVVNGIPIVQAYSSGSAIGVIDVPLGGGTPSVTVRNVRPDSLPADSAIAALTTALLSTTAAHFREPVAVVAERMETGTRGTLGNLIADAQRWAGGGDVAIMNRGGLRAALPAGTVTRGSLFEVQPFGNALVRISLRGAELRSWLERLASRDDVNFFLSGVRVVVDSTKPAGHRIVKVTLSDGRVLDERRVYRLVMSDFLAVGGDGLNLTERAIAVEELKLVDVDVLERYLGSRPSPVRAPTDARLVPLGK